ncbi:MAG: phosphoribosyl-ATP diphosphatase, partial [Cyclobacteriaceae bacterium]
VNPKAGSYTTELFEKGINKIAQKVGEEAVELVIESKDNNAELFLNEAADLMYHYLVLLQAKGYQLQDVAEVLRARHKG